MPQEFPRDKQYSWAPRKESRGRDSLQVAVKTEGGQGKGKGATDVGRGLRKESLHPFLISASNTEWSM